MVSSIGNYSNVSFGNIGATTNAAPYIAAPYQHAAVPVDTVEIAGKKKGNAGKAALGIVGTVLVAGAALYGLFKTGKLKHVEGATKWTEKLGNLAYKGGESIDKGVKVATEKGKPILEKVKTFFANAKAKIAEKFSKKAPEAQV